jgi:Flp pilus assembly protein TadG
MRKFIRDERGNFATMLALVAVPVLIAVGGAADLAMAYRNNAVMQNALDSALLAAGRLDGTIAEKRQVAAAYFNPQVAHLNILNTVLTVNPTIDGIGLTGSVTAEYNTALLGVFGRDRISLGVGSEVRAGSGQTLDIALVLDNTSSLGADGLEAVREASQNFRDQIFAVSQNSPRVQMAVIPFAGAVNVGRDFPDRYLDVNGDAPWHGRSFEYRAIARIDPSCTPVWDDGPADPGDGTVESFLFVPLWLRDLPQETARVFAEVVGVKPAHAGPAQDHGMSEGYGTTSGGGCSYLINPPKINHFALFDSLPNVNWGGCVEARADEFDTTDELPRTSDPRSLFVPYFWPDEPDSYANWVPAFTNNYMADHQSDLPWNPDSWAETEYWGRLFAITKYAETSAVLNGASQYIAGPNRGCPQPLQELTSNGDSVDSALDTMSLADGGGTVISEGVAWGWRVLSPTEPFTEASSEPSAKRIMVVMSDGENQISRNPRNPSPTGDDHRGSPTVSDYNAYGYLRWHRFGGEPTFADVEAELDERTLEICTNAKAEGIEIHTVLFRSNAQRAIDVLRQCATDADHFHLAADSAKLSETFQGIAAAIGSYRLTR